MTLTLHAGDWKVLALISLILTVLLGLCFYFRDIFLILVLGHALSVIADRLMSDYRNRMAKHQRSRWKRRLYVALTLIFWASATLFLLWTSVDDLNQAFKRIDTENLRLRVVYLKKVAPHLSGLITERIVTPDMVQGMEDYITSLFSSLLRYLVHFLFIGVLIIPIQINMYFGRKGDAFRRALESIPVDLRPVVHRVVKEAASDAQDIFAGRVVVSLAVASVCCLGYFVAGVKGWLLFGVVAGVLTIVPYIGPILSALPPLVITLSLDIPIAAVYVLVTILVAELLKLYYLEPFMLSKRVHVHPLLGVLLPLAGAETFGIMGMIFAVPIFSVYKIILREAHKELVRIHGAGT
jgi:predicted PurR-regulated permease PerM